MTKDKYIDLLKRAERDQSVRPFIEALIKSKKDMAPGATFRAALHDYILELRSEMAHIKKMRH